jgi:hypothetical protein
MLMVQVANKNRASRLPGSDVPAAVLNCSWISAVPYSAQSWLMWVHATFYGNRLRVTAVVAALTSRRSGASVCRTLNPGICRNLPCLIEGSCHFDWPVLGRFVYVCGCNTAQQRQSAYLL